jgi:heme/copper-type cytochrome/quinol oxidase subunit 2
VDSFWERVPYICIAIIVFIIFWLLTKLFKFFVRKLRKSFLYSPKFGVGLNRVGSTAILFFGFLIALVIMIPGFTPGQLMSALGSVRSQLVLHLKIFSKTCFQVF